MPMSRKNFVPFLMTAIAIVALSAGLGWSALETYLTIEAQNQGPIEGDVVARGLEGSIKVYGIKHQITLPTDESTGAITGAPEHKPLTIIKHLDKSSPKLIQAMTTGEQLAEVELHLYKEIDGSKVLFYTIRLENALIVDYKLTQLNTMESAFEKYREMEEFSFQYERIQWVHEIEGIEAEDSMLIPRL